MSAQEVASPEFWRRCSSCKNPIKYSSKYFVCSVSTCNRKRIGYVFDSVHCWERHLPGARHRDAAAVEEMSPTFAQWQAELAASPAAGPASVASPAGAGVSSNAEAQARAVAEARAPQKFITRTGSPGASAQAPTRFNDTLESEILIVVSKMKAYVKERADMNTSDSVSQVLSGKVRRLIDRAVERARADGRKTLMDRDFES